MVATSKPLSCSSFVWPDLRYLLIQIFNMKDKQLINEVVQFQKLAGLLKEDDYSDSDNDSNESSDNESEDTDAMSGIDEAGNIKGIKIEIPGNSNAVDFGKAAAREVIESFGPREYRNFLEAFLNEFKKITGGV